jgi:hypothetical protein
VKSLLPWATALAAWTLGLAFVADRIRPPDDWTRMWLVSAGLGALAAGAIYLVGGWWYRARLTLSGASRPDRDRARRVYLFAAQVWAVPGLAYLAWESATYPTPRAAAAGHDPGAAFVVVCLFASVVVSFVAARSSFELRPWPARVWFLLLPALVYALALGATVAAVHVSRVGGLEVPAALRPPARIERVGFSLELPPGWTIDTSDPEYDPDHDFTVEPPDLDAAVRFVLHDSPSEPEEAVETTRRDLAAAFDATVAGTFERWGEWEGAGLRLEASLQVKRYVIMVFSGTTGDASFEVVELSEASALDAALPAFERMRASFELK